MSSSRRGSASGDAVVAALEEGSAAEAAAAAANDCTNTAHTGNTSDDEDDRPSAQRSPLLSRRKPAYHYHPQHDDSAWTPITLSEEEIERQRKKDEEAVYAFIWNEMRTDRSFYAILAIAALVEGSQQMSALALQYLLKDDLNVTPSMQSILFGVCAIPWVMKPIWGFISDAFPICSWHRRSYLFIGAGFASFMWLLMALQPNLTYTKVLLKMLCIEVGHAVLSTVAKALLVEHCEGREQRYASFLQTYYHVFLYSSSLLFAFLGGYTLTHGVKKSVIFGLTAIMPGIGAIVSLFVHENPPSGLSVREQCTKLWEVVRYPQPHQPYALWRPMLFMVLFSMGPNSGTAMFYFFTERLGFNPQFISYMNMISTLFALIGIVLYQKYFSDTPHRTILCYGMLLTVSFAMLPILVVTRANISMGIPDEVFMLSDKAIIAAVSRIAHIPVLIMGAQLCPAGIEGTLYALMMSMLNFGGMLAEHNTAFLMWILGVKKGQYTNLPLLITCCCLFAILPLLLLNQLLPYGGDLPQDQFRSSRQAAADAEAAEAEPQTDGISDAHEEQREDERKAE